MTSTITANNELRKRLDRLDDIEKIKRLKYRYLMCIDTGEFDTFRELCVKNVDIDLKGGAYHLIFDNVEDFILSNKKAFSNKCISSHTGHHPQIDILSDTTASGSWYLIDMFINITDKLVYNGTAVYQDLYEKIDGNWKFTRISYRRVYETVDPLTYEPHITASIVRRHNV